MILAHVQKGIESLLNGVKTVAVTCLQWGDTGKGKFVDLLSSAMDIIVRGGGGANAGHTIIAGALKLIQHLIPSGIVYDKEGKICVMGSGMVIDPEILISEMDALDQAGMSYDNLMLAMNAKLTLPIHVLLDCLSESRKGKGKIGTTRRGIGQTYCDFYARRGLFINDLLNPDIFASKLKRNLEFNMRLVRSYDPEVIKEIMHEERMGKGIYYNPKTILDVDAIIGKYIGIYGKKLAGIIRDTDTFAQDNVGKKGILLEGAQGALLSIAHGSYPFVTSSDCCLDGLLSGCGLNRCHLDLALGIIKFPYMTRVGAGPFPTEMGDKQSDDWCNERKGKANREIENARFGKASINDAVEFFQGVAIRREGDEFGATTKRPRRVGWFDVPIFRHALRWGSKDVILTKVDVLNSCETIKICDWYEYKGPDYFHGRAILRNGDRIYEAIPGDEVLRYCVPHYREFPGWMQSLEKITDPKDLPGKLTTIINHIIVQTGAKIRIVSTGADRNETIFVDSAH